MWQDLSGVAIGFNLLCPVIAESRMISVNAGCVLSAGKQRAYKALERKIRKCTKQDLMPLAPEHAFDPEVMDFSDLERIEEAIAPVLIMVQTGGGKLLRRRRSRVHLPHIG
jgi:hypothetical protein